MPPPISGIVTVDLTEAKPDHMRATVTSACMGTPRGSTLILTVGALAPVASVVWVLRERLPRINLEIHGTSRGVRMWIEAVRDGMPGELGV